jgi:hypothetical protein
MTGRRSRTLRGLFPGPPIHNFKGRSLPVVPGGVLEHIGATFVADHLAALGIGSSSAEDRQELVRKILSESKPHSQRPDSITLVWHDPSGAELWIYLDPTGNMKAVVPHFSGGPRLRLEIQAVVERPDVSSFDGGFVALTQSGGASPAMGGFAVVFDSPDFPDVKRVFLTSKHDVELVGFAVELNVYANVDELKEAQPEMKPLDPPSFIPAGLMSQMEGSPPTAHALMVGNLLEADLVKNDLTGLEFLCLQVETPAGPIALVADPSLLSEIPEAGSMIQAGAWLSGRLLADDPVREA